MEYQKDFGKFSFGFGTAKTAGRGDLAHSEEVPRFMKYKPDLKAILKTGAKAAAVAGIVCLGRRRKKRK